MSEVEALSLNIQLKIAGDDVEELDQATRYLRAELADQGVGEVSLAVSGSMPDGAKAVDPVLLGAIVVAVMPQVIEKILSFIHEWAMRREGRQITIKIQDASGNLVEVSVPSSISQEEVSQWIAKVKTTLPTNPKRQK